MNELDSLVASASTLFAQSTTPADLENAKAQYLGYRIGQLGVRHYPRTAGQQTGAKITVILRAFRELFKLYADIKRERGVPV